MTATLAAVSTVEGRAGRATRTDPRSWRDTFGKAVVDHWDVYPVDGGCWKLVLVQKDGRYLLAVGRVDPVRMLIAALVGMPPRAAVDMVLDVEVKPLSPWYARQLCRQAARTCVRGELPMPPTTNEAKEEWAVTLRLLLLSIHAQQEPAASPTLG